MKVSKEMIKVALQIAAAICGLYAAYLWWQSSDNIRVLAEMPSSSQGGEGDQLIKLSDGKYILYDNAKQGKLNKSAAAWTAASVAFQAAAIFVGLI